MSEDVAFTFPEKQIFPANFKFNFKLIKFKYVPWDRQERLRVAFTRGFHPCMIFPALGLLHRNADEGVRGCFHFDGC